MKLCIYSVLDNKAQAFLAPFFMSNDAVALRAFADAANDPTHQFFKNPNDYCLYRIGAFFDDTGVIEADDVFCNMGLASILKEV